jgi:hypothetical protein
MTPLAAALPFASKCCSVGAELLAVYAGNTGFISNSSNGGDYAMQASAQSQQLAQLRQVLRTTRYTDSCRYLILGSLISCSFWSILLAMLQLCNRDVTLH